MRNASGQLVEQADAPEVIGDEILDAVAEAARDLDNHYEELGEPLVDLAEKKLSKQYKKFHACPVCKLGDDIHSLGEIDPMDSDFAYQKCECGHCGSTWKEEWKMVAIYGIEVGDNNNP